jgi:hypothetical protein
MTIYHRLMDAEAYRNKTVPSAKSLYQESQALMFAGTDTVGAALMVGTHRLLANPDKMQKLKAELVALWPSLEGEGPRLRELENFPYLNAVVKEALRLSSGVTSGLPRVVPPSGATIAGANVPAGVGFFLCKNSDLLANLVYRRLFRAAVLLSTSTPRYSLTQKRLFRSAGLSRLSWTTGLSPFRVVRACA